MDKETIKEALDTLGKLRYDDHGVDRLKHIVFQMELAGCGEIESIRHAGDGSVSYKACSGKTYPYTPEKFESDVRLVTYKVRCLGDKI